MFTVTLTENAFEDLKAYPKADQVLLLDAAQTQLSHEPTKPTRRRRQLQPNALSRWELRIGDYRMFYDVNAASQQVSVKSIGIKSHKTLFIRGREYTL